MGRSPCCDADADVKKGPWSPEEDKILKEYIEKNGCGNWRSLPKLAGLNRCGKSCRLRWANYLRPDIKRGRFSSEEEQLIIHLHSLMGNKWSKIASELPGRTDNEIKNYWNTHLRKKLLMSGVDPVTHRPRTDLNPLANLQNLVAAANLNPFVSSALELQKLQVLQSLIHLMGLQTLNPPMQALNSGFMPMLNNLDGSTNVVNVPSFMTTPANSAPSLVAASPENCTVDDQDQGQAREAAVNMRASSSTNSGGLTLDDLDSDEFGWKDILDQISWADEL